MDTITTIMATIITITVIMTITAIGAAMATVVGMAVTVDRLSTRQCTMAATILSELTMPRRIITGPTVATMDTTALVQVSRSAGKERR